jgi:hypothetical protein
MLHRVKLVGKGASVLMGRVVVGGEGVLGVSVLTPSLRQLVNCVWDFCLRTDNTSGIQTVCCGKSSSKGWC